jgi:anti-sigma factor (TIGR02949 family)
MTQEAQATSGSESDCDKLRRLLHEYVDGELEQSLAATIKRHVAKCKHCDLRVIFETAFHRAVARHHESRAVPKEVQERCEKHLAEWRKSLS